LIVLRSGNDKASSTVTPRKESSMKNGLRHVGVGMLVLGSLACGDGKDSSFANGAGSGVPGTGANKGTLGNLGGSVGGSVDGGLSPLSALQANCDDAGRCTCVNGSTTTIEGFVYDPAGVNPLYNVTVYVPDPNSPLPNLDSVPLGCGCSQLYPSTVLATSYPTDATGHFVIPCAPSGNVSLVVQTGKWRRQYDNIAVTANTSNQAPKLTLPANSSEGSLPNIAISTGGADSLECLPLRLGVSSSEYVLGSAADGHIHIYTGYHGATMAQGSVASPQTLWDGQSDMNQHDVVLLSCEGAETAGMTSTSQTYLMNYANAGGRVFASHFHYAWFNTGPFSTTPNQLATWITGAQSIDDKVSFSADIDTTLAGGAPFPEGSALEQWLNGVGALTNGQLPIWFARHNVQALVQPPSTEWIHLDPSVSQAPSATQYFSVDTPIGGAAGSVCGRIVYSDLHVSGGPNANEPGVSPDYPSDAGTGGSRYGGGGGMHGGIVPSGCASHPLTPQEEALEFMLFDLSSCLVPIGQTTSAVPTIIPR
jgi:hypothetical protein